MTHSTESQPGMLCVLVEMSDETWLSRVHFQNNLLGMMLSSEEENEGGKAAPLIRQAITAHLGKFVLG